MSDLKDFVIVKNILKNYNGKDENVIIPDTVKEIADHAFERNNFIKTVKIPATVKAIGRYVFRDCTELISVEIADGLNRIGEMAFDNCINLTEIKIPDTVTEIDFMVFGSCNSLKKVYLSSGIQKIKPDAFGYCPNADVYFSGNPECVKNRLGCVNSIIAPEIPASAFISSGERFNAVQGFFSNISLYEDDEIKKDYIAFAAKSYKKHLSWIFESDNVAAITLLGENKKITVKNFDEEFFEPAEKAQAQGCIAYLLDWKSKNITEDDINKKLEKELTKDPFNVSDMKKIWSFENTSDETVMITDYKGNDEAVCIPERIGNRAVTALGDFVFSNYRKGFRRKPYARQQILEKITSISIPDTVVSVGEAAFYGCSELQSVNIPDSITEICDSTFGHCWALDNIKLPDGIKKIGDKAFEYCSSIRKIEIPVGVSEINTGTFRDCRSLEKIEFAGTITKIDNEAFSDCHMLKNIALPYEPMSIGYRAFYNCVSLTDIRLPANVSGFDYSTFSRCKNLTIHAPKDSCVQKLAERFEISFVAEE